MCLTLCVPPVFLPYSLLTNQELRFSVGSAEERAILLETLDALRKREAQPHIPIAWGAWETGSACSEPVE